MIERLMKTAGRLKKLQPYLHRIAVIYFVYTVIRNRRAKRAARKAGRNA